MAGSKEKIRSYSHFLLLEFSKEEIDRYLAALGAYRTPGALINISHHHICLCPSGATLS